MASSVYSAYAQSAGEINNNLASFREDVDNVKAVNKQLEAKQKQLIQGAYQKTDLDALRGLGEEVGIRTFKKYGGKALDYVDNRFLGGKIESDTEGFKNILKNKFNQLRGKAETTADDLMGRGRNAFREGEGRLDGLRNRINERIRGGGEDADGDVEMNEIGGGSGNQEGGEGFEADGTETIDALDDPANVDDEAMGDMSFEDFMNQFSVPRTETGDIDFDRAGEQLQMGEEDMRGQQLRSNAPERTPSQAPEETGTETKEDAPETETKEGDGDEGLEAGEEELADTGATEGIEEGVGAGLEGVGAGLDATGVGAIVGVPLQVAGAVLEGGALYEAGKGIVDWVEQLFGKKPDVPDVKKVAMPTQMPTLAQKGMLITPTMDTLDTQPSFAGGW